MAWQMRQSWVPKTSNLWVSVWHVQCCSKYVREKDPKCMWDIIYGLTDGNQHSNCSAGVPWLGRRWLLLHQWLQSIFWGCLGSIISGEGQWLLVRGWQTGACYICFQLLQCTFKQHRDTIPNKKVCITFIIIRFEPVRHGKIVQVMFFQVAKGIVDDLPGGSKEICIMYANLQKSTQMNRMQSESQAVWDASWANDSGDELRQLVLLLGLMTWV